MEYLIFICCWPETPRMIYVNTKACKYIGKTILWELQGLF